MHVPGNTLLHQMPAQCKILAAILLAGAIVTTPRKAFWAFTCHLILLLFLLLAGHVPWSHARGRLLIDLPFLVAASALPFVGTGPRVEVLGLSLSIEGNWGAWNIAAKSLLGVITVLVLTATTTPRDLITGFERLRVPRALTLIAHFMLRYLDLVIGQFSRLRVARISRGHNPHFFWQARAVAVTAGTVFVRTFERGERLQQVMLSRGFQGTFPPGPNNKSPDRQDWTGALFPSFCAWSVTIIALVLH